MDAGPTDRIAAPTEPTGSPESSGDSRPVILFDGVCNLCNAAVQWVIVRDPNERFRFASLQSEAARGVLEATSLTDGAPALPDSIVLADADGIHTRSTAALRIARGLGFPFSLLGLTAVVPRPLRDTAYQFIARNRYRWFGRQDTCMVPTPDLASRFLDAGEPRVHLPDPGRPDSETVGAASWMGAWLSRLAVTYVLVYIVHFFATLAPFTTWVGEVVFGVNAIPAATGSGDQTFNFLTLFVDVAIALVLATAWTAQSGARRVSARFFDFSRFIARFYLGFFLLTYGWVKVFPLQFSLPGPDRLIQPYGDSSPMGLAWTFLGASIGYQIFSGFMELLGGYLLFWRRTTLLGSIVTAAVMTNVMAINYFYDVPVKLFSTHLFLIAVFLMAPDLPRLVGLTGFNLPTASRSPTRFWIPRGRWLWVTVAVHVLVVGALTAMHVTNNLSASRARGVLSTPSPLAGVYRVESFERNGLADRALDDDVRWVRVGLNPPFAVTVQRASGDAVRMRLAIDEGAGTLSVFERGAQAPEVPTFTYSEPEAGQVRLEGEFEGGAMVVVMKKDDVGSLLTERGFHWINEFPFNR